MGERVWNLLVVDDDGDHRELVRRALEEPGGTVFALSGAESLREAREILARGGTDLVLADWHLPDGEGIDLLPPGEAPFGLVVMTAQGDERLAVGALKRGALDFFLKSQGFFETLPLVMERALREWERVLELRVARSAEAEARERLGRFLDELPAVALLKDAEGRYLFVNRALREDFEARDWVGRKASEVRSPAVAARIEEEDREALRRGEVLQEVIFRDAQGRKRWYHQRKFVLGGPGPVLLGGLALDVTELRQEEERRRVLEERLRQMERLEGLGRLAGGIAHDFNNLLTPILGYADLLQERLEPGDPLGALLVPLRAAAERAAELTRQLVAFSGKQTLRLAPLALDQVVRSCLPRLRAALGDRVELEADLPGDLWPLQGDAEQIREALCHLAANARDAMPEGGRFVLRGRNLVGTEEEGDEVLLEVEDTGRGMEGPVLGRVFEPFFTTKRTGEGSGLGLPTVRGILVRHGGRVEVESRPGVGTVLRLRFPRLCPQEPARPGEGRRLLVVEDDEAVRRLLCDLLSSAGHEVLPASGPASALRMLGADLPVDAALVDLCLGDQDGRALADRLRERSPGLRVLFLSGSPGELLPSRSSERGEDVLPKPFVPGELFRRLEILLAPSRSGEAPGV